MQQIFVGDIGTVLLLDCGVNITSATSVKVIAKSPQGLKKEFIGTVDGTNNVKYTTSSADFDVAGNWLLQSYVQMPDWTGRGAWVTLTVKD